MREKDKYTILLFAPNHELLLQDLLIRKQLGKYKYIKYFEKSYSKHITEK